MQEGRGSALQSYPPLGTLGGETQAAFENSGSATVTS